MRPGAALLPALALLGCAAAPPRAGATPAAQVAPRRAATTPAPAAAAIDWSAPPAPGPEPTFRLPPRTSLRLGNGLRVLVAARPTLPLVTAVLVAPDAGAGADPAGRAGLAAYTADLLDEGTTRRDALGIADELERLGAVLTVGAAFDESSLSVSTLARTLEPTLALAADLVAHPAFRAADLARVRADRLTAILQRRDLPRAVANLVFGAALYGRGHPYGWPLDGTEETLRRLTRADVLGFHRARWRPDRSTLLVVGDVRAEALAPILERTFGAWRSARGAAPPPPALPAPGGAAPRLIVVDKPGAPQTEVRVGMPAAARSTGDYFALEVLNTVLGGSFSSRLNNRLREQLGYTYGAFSSFVYRKGPGPFVTASALQTPATVDGTRELLAILAELARAPVGRDELLKARQYLTRGLAQRFEGNDGVAEALSELVVYDLPDDTLDRYAERAERVDAAAVQAAATRYLAGDRLSVVLVGDRARFGGDLAKLGLGPPAEWAPDGAPKRR